MESELRALVSRRVTEAWEKAGELGVGFAHGAVLKVRWPHRLMKVAKAELIAGQRLISLSAGTSQITFEFSGGARLLVRIADDEECGVPGLYLTTRQGRLVEWPRYLDEAA